MLNSMKRRRTCSFLQVGLQIFVMERKIERAGAFDVGGDPESFAPILENDEEKPIAFWEKQVHAMLSLLSVKKLMTVDEMRRGIESLPEKVYCNWRYYEKWAASIGAILLERGLISDAELNNALGPVEETELPEFKVGDYVRVKHENTLTRWRKPHIRTPGYIFGAVGQIQRIIGTFEDPSLFAFRLEGRTQILYKVSFLQRHIWSHYKGNQNDFITAKKFMVRN